MNRVSPKSSPAGSGVPFALAGIGAITMLICLAGSFAGWQRTAGIGVGAALLAAGLVLRSAAPGLLALETLVFGLLTAPFFTILMARAVYMDFWSGEVESLRLCLTAPFSGLFNAPAAACDGCKSRAAGVTAGGGSAPRLEACLKAASKRIGSRAAGRGPPLPAAHQVGERRRLRVHRPRRRGAARGGVRETPDPLGPPRGRLTGSESR